VLVGINNIVGKNEGRGPPLQITVFPFDKGIFVFFLYFDYPGVPGKRREKFFQCA
jgi:hypothetical protein